jgi:exopolysaccharide production protein ExoY
MFKFISPAGWIVSLSGVAVIGGVLHRFYAARKKQVRRRESTGADHATVHALSHPDTLNHVVATRASPAPPVTVRDRPIGGKVKRAMDIVISLLAIVVLAPLMLMIVALIRLTMGGPLIFAHHRVGFDGATFTCYKFRTMVVNAEEVLSRYLAANPCAAKQWRETRKLWHDPRVGCIDNILRKSSLDELPQLFNVLRGEMSIVGPRPIVASEVRNYGRHAEAYFQARPGLTGIWPVSGRNRLSYRARVGLDRYYVRNWSIRLDVMILLKTIPALLSFRDTA